MNYRLIGKFISKMLMVEGVFMLPALGISIYCGEMDSVYGFAGRGKVWCAWGSRG